MSNTIRLYKPLSPAQLEKVSVSGWRSFAVESSQQKLFYPKIHKHYAEKFARQWDAVKYNRGYVVAFDVPVDFMARFDIQTVASEEHREYKVPVADLALLNEHIIGNISVVSAFKRQGESIVIVHPQRTDVSHYHSGVQAISASLRNPLNLIPM